MVKTLKIKDPIFGYISVEDQDLYSVINSAMFQRLRDIVQTSYPSVYPSAVHNRFTHSLGVYHLGKIAQASLISDATKQKLAQKEKLENLGKTFLLACLMHDIGHSPFSHTGERFYFEDQEDGQPKIWKLLVKELEGTDFSKDLQENSKPVGAEHEIMSAYVSMINFPKILGKYDKSFFTRCIIGLKYSQKNDIRNCFIDLLNSKTIDVDKLDYLIRDSYTTGFKSISIDYNRLLEAVSVIAKNNEFVLGFNKSALSTLESVILAHDMERKWIQNHPVIKYEGLLVSHMIAEAQGSYRQKGISLFSPEALSENGVVTKSDNVCLLSDSDINTFAKKLYNKDSIIKEYFFRGIRKKTLWKSEAEYRSLVNEDSGVIEDIFSMLEQRIKSLEITLFRQFKFPVINQNSLDFFTAEYNDSSIPEALKKGKQKELEKVIGLINIFKNYSAEVSIPFEYVISSTNQFKTGFNKEEFKEIQVIFGSQKICKLKNVLNLFSAKHPRDNFFYIYVDSNARENIDVSILLNRIIDYTLEEYRQQKVN